MGLAADRVGERVVLVIGLVGCGAFLLGAAAAHGFWALLLLLAAAGASGASVQSASGRAVTHWFAPSERGLALGIRQTAIPISGFLVAIALPPVVRAGGVAWGFATLGLSCVVGALVWALGLREGQGDGCGCARRPAAPAPRPAHWTLSIGSALILAPQLCVAGFAVLFLHERRGVSPSAAAAVLAVVQLLGIGGRIAAGRWSDVLASRVGPLRTLALTAAAFVALTAPLLTAPLRLLVPCSSPPASRR